MYKDILHFYKSINEANIRNPMDSLYWLYRVENLVVQQNGVCHRYLKVYFFNRQFTEDDNLMQMKLDFHGEIITVMKFKTAQEFQNKSIMGFLYEIDLADECEDLHLISYIKDGKETILQGPWINHIDLSDNAHDVCILKDYIMKSPKDVYVYPSIQKDVWMCCCGYINKAEDYECPMCNRSKEDMYTIHSLSLKDEACRRIACHPEKVIFNCSDPFDKQISALCRYCHDYYGIDEDTLLKQLNKEKLLEIYNKCINEHIIKYLKDTPPSLDVNQPFENVIDKYVNKICNAAITEEMVTAHLDMYQLKLQYDELYRVSKQDKERKKKNYIIMGLVSGVIITALVIVSVLSGKDSSDSKKQDIADHTNQVFDDKKVHADKQAYKAHITAGVYSTFGVDEKGLPHFTGLRDQKYESGQSQIEGWKDLVQISSEQYHTVGLKKDGHVVSTQIKSSEYDVGQSRVDDWEDIQQVSAATYNTVALRKDGTVVSTKINDSRYDFGQTDVENWTDIIKISAAWDHTIGLKQDGSVVSTHINNEKYDYGETDVENWTDIIDISSGANHTVGLKRNGSVIAVGYRGDGRCDVSSWTGVKAVSAGRFHTLALLEDGTVVSTHRIDEKGDFGQDNIYDWTGISEISAGWFHSTGLKEDGTIVSTEINRSDEDMGQSEVVNWNLKIGGK